MTKRLTSEEKYGLWDSTSPLNWDWACADADKRAGVYSIQNHVEYLAVTSDNSSIHQVLGHPWISVNVAVKKATQLLARKADYVYQTSTRIWIWEDPHKTWRLLISTRGPSIEIASRLKFHEGHQAIKDLFKAMGFSEPPQNLWHQQLREFQDEHSDQDVLGDMSDV